MGRDITACTAAPHDSSAQDERVLAAAPAAERHRCRITALQVDEAPTRDAVALDVAAVVCWHVHDVQLAAVAFQRGRLDITRVGLAALRATIDASTLAEMLCERAAVDQSLRLCIRRKTELAGITVHSAEIRELRMPAAAQVRLDALVLAELGRCRACRTGLAVAA